jgi:tetratricopeptide (TPR) repeat protein
MMRWILKSFFILYVLSASPFGWAQSAVPEGYEAHSDHLSMFEYANTLYSQGELQKAADGYHYLVEQGVSNGYLFYNLGNTEFQLGNTGKAILWYERAKQYLPRFGDLKYNLNYARQTLVDEEFRQPTYRGTMAFFAGFHDFLNVRESLILLGILVWVFAILICARIMFRSEYLLGWLRPALWTAGILLSLGLLSTGTKIHHLYFDQEAIVQVSALNVKTGAGKDFSTHFSLHEGTKVRVLNQQDGWARIDLPMAPGFTGYVPMDAVEII